jgi:hypothetical protein
MINTITTLRLPDGSTVAFEDWSDKPLYASVDLVHGFTREKIEFLGYTEGEQVPAASPGANIPREATVADTNMQAPASMASTEERMIYAIKPQYIMLTADEPEQGQPIDLTTASARDGTGEPIPNVVALGVLAWRLVFTLMISQKEFAQASLGYFNSGFGPFASGGTMAAAAAAGRTYGNAGIPSQEAVRSYVVPQYAGGTEKLKAYLTNPTGEPVNFGISENGAVPANTQAVMTIRMFFEGLYKRPVS